MAILCGWPEMRGAEGKGFGIWTDGGFGGMLCVVRMRGRQQGAGQSVCSHSRQRAASQRLDRKGETNEEKGDGGEKGSRNQKTCRKRRGCLVKETRGHYDQGRKGWREREDKETAKESH